MSDIRFVTIATYGTSGEAHLAKNMLAAHEIPALLDGAALVEHWSPRVGSLTGGIKLQVSEAEAERASQLLDEVHTRQLQLRSSEEPWQCRQCGALSSGDVERCSSCGTMRGDEAGEVPLAAEPIWLCAKCGKDVAESFEVCWNCGTSRLGEEDPRFRSLAEDDEPAFDPGDTADDTAAGDVVPAPTPAPAAEAPAWICPTCNTRVSMDDAQCWSCGTTATGKLNPYYTWTAQAPGEPPRQIAAEDAEVEALAKRAWVAAVMGILVFPPLMNLYSIWLLIDLAFTPGKLSPQGRRRRTMAILVNVLVLVAVVLFGSMVMGYHINFFLFSRVAIR